MTDHKATPEQWTTDAARWLEAILELRARVELLEAAQPSEKADIVDYYAALAAQHQGRAVFHEDHKPTPNSSQIRSSLVERVAIAISRCEDSAAWDDEAINWAPEARAAIREVAAWLREHYGGPTASSTALEQETGK
jgi:hypothetical protein